MVVQKEKFERMESPATHEALTVSHVTIRQSISFLIIRLITLEFIAILGLVSSLLFFFNDDIQNSLGGYILLVNIPFFISIVFIKTAIMILIVMRWLNEYYEINTKYIVHRRGFIFKKEERYTLKHLGKVKLEQGIFGRLLNYGNVRVFNWALEKEVNLYLIHNPIKAVRILETLLPDADEESETVREHLIEEDKE